MPAKLRFGTSGRRGRIAEMSPWEVYCCVTGELRFLLSLEPAAGGIRPGDDFFVACDLRPSSPWIAGSVTRAVTDAGLNAVNLGRIPTPALAAYAFARGRGSIMVTGSHIPFDYNGYKANKSNGELRKDDEQSIEELVEEARRTTPPAYGTGALGPELPGAAEEYLNRYTAFFKPGVLSGQRLLVYLHSSVGGDLVAEALRRLGAEVTTAGRSETFVAIDTENVNAAMVERIEGVAQAAGCDVDWIVSVDGDADRPLILKWEDGRARFFPGDRVGKVAAEFLGARTVAVPITANDWIDSGPFTRLRTKVGSPFVVAAMDEALRAGEGPVCGWESNGGFLTGSGFEHDGRKLAALPTRDAVLPIVCFLAAGGERQPPARFTAAGLLAEFPRTLTRQVFAFDFAATFLGAPESEDWTDGKRMTFAGGDVVHLRPSGNADEFRVYAAASTEARASELVSRVLALIAALR